MILLHYLIKNYKLVLHNLLLLSLEKYLFLQIKTIKSCLWQMPKSIYRNLQLYQIIIN